ncbi:Uncharacterised protein [Chlamydia trachomatis]|nr:Uncharacterised protein [Chlamydia trachomatis]CRH46610.1 Uncharacterised protein [Chlamydia trachomatis]CRH54845.1 Uncharacterised protein [Chlamydia trachomatis]CRH54851.1 Uncharacterised protein [Chlamydia trachomatis]CRH54855.1 Uncharacterised protein [Chlamydia trachomatis]
MIFIRKLESVLGFLGIGFGVGTSGVGITSGVFSSLSTKIISRRSFPISGELGNASN